MKHVVAVSSFALGLCAWLLSFSDVFAAEPAAADEIVLPEPQPSASVSFENGAGWRVQIEVVADDAPSAAFVRDLARDCEVTLARVFPSALLHPSASVAPPLPKPVLKVDIVLLSRKSASWAEPFLCIPRSEGGVLLALKWTRETSLETVRAALVRAAITRLVLVNNAAKPLPAAPAPSAEAVFATVPRWLVDALLLEQDARARPALDGAWLARARRAPPPAFAAIGTEAGSPQASFWFLRHLRRELYRASVSESDFFRGLVSGGSPEQVLERHFPAIAADAEQRALWWPVGFANLAHAPSRAVQSIEESAALFERETSFLFAPAGVDRRFSPIELPSLLPLPAVQKEIETRILRLRHGFFRVNPVWHNAFQSYGVFLECIHSANANERANLWKQVVTDAAVAHQLQLAIGRVLAEAAADAGTVGAMPAGGTAP